MPHDYWINEHRHYYWFDDEKKSKEFYDVDVKINNLTKEEKEKLIQFVRDLGNGNVQ